MRSPGPARRFFKLAPISLASYGYFNFYKIIRCLQQNDHAKIRHLDNRFPAENDAPMVDMPALIAYIVGMQYTLRKVPRDVDKTLRQKAKKEGRSLNEIAVEALTRGAGIDRAIVKNHDLDFAIGTWVFDPELEASLNTQRQIDPDLWK